MRTKDYIVKVIERQAGAAYTGRVQDHSNLILDLKLSSSDISLLLFEIELKFNLVFPDEIITSSSLTVKRIVEYVETRD